MPVQNTSKSVDFGNLGLLLYHRDDTPLHVRLPALSGLHLQESLVGNMECGRGIWQVPSSQDPSQDPPRHLPGPIPGT